MHSVPATMPVRPTARRLTIIAESPYGRNQRLEMLVTPGMTVAGLHSDEYHATLVQPGGGVLAADDDLFEIAADTPRLFALRTVSSRISEPAVRRQRLAALARVVGMWRRRHLASS